ncbi:hypothetical protein RB595_005528 [Gaeumannomyces hyphopodioides]
MRCTLSPRALRHVRASSARAFSSTARRLDTYGFIGLGQMGYQMAKNLQAKLPPSDTVRLFDINRDAMQKLAAEMKASPSQAGGAAVELAESADAASTDADTVITVLPEPSHVKSVYASIVSHLQSLAPTGATGTETQPPRRLFMDCSTIDPASSREVAALVAEGTGGAAALVDAPMSGGVVGAAAGTLTFMLGAGDGGLAGRAEPTLLRMGRRVLRCGGQGSGLAAKLANNYLLAVANVAAAEAMNMGVRAGLDPAVLAGVLNASTGRCWPTEVNNPVPGVCPASPAGRGYAGGFGLALMRKDLALAASAARAAGARLELAEKTREVYDAADAREDCRGRDFSVVYRYLGGKE